jgi:two-component system, OmpR family, phosphate regulon sensor histidine kinase PhoR
MGIDPQHRREAEVMRRSSGSRLDTTPELELRRAREELAVRDKQLSDLRERIDAEQRRYAELFDLAPVGYLVTDLDGVVREANRTAAELLGREISFLVGEPFAALVGPERRHAFRALTRRAADGARWQDEVPFVQPDGGRVRLIVTASGAGVGADAAIRWSLSDVPSEFVRPDLEGQAAEAARSLQRQRLASLLDRLQRAVVSVSSSLRVTYANSAAANLLAGGRNVVGETLTDPWPTPAPSICDLTARMFEHGAAPTEVLVNLDDERRSYEVLALPADASGDALLVIADVTVQERRQRAEREFVANAAHQLRTPVSAIASAIEVLQGGAKEDPETRDRFLSHLDRQCNRLVRLTRALLVLARAQSLAEPPAVEIVPVHPLLVSISHSLRPGEDVRVRVECPFDLAALTNLDLLEQAVEVLAQNAAKYTRAGEIVLSAARIRGPKVRIAVSDSGPGASFADGGFRRFYRDPGAQGEGFGLGLAIAEETMRALGGELQIESDEGGTRAAVTLPAATVRHP